MVTKLALIYLNIGIVFLLVGLFLGVWVTLRKDPDLSELSNNKLFVLLCLFHVLGWPLIVKAACAKLWRKITEVSGS